MKMVEVMSAWDRAPLAAIHPTRRLSEADYWASGSVQAAQLASVFPSRCSVLDFGCGDGRVAVPMQRHGYRVIGVDSSQRMLDELAKNTPKTKTIRSDGSDLLAQLGGKKVDAAYCLAVLIHHSYSDATKIITNLMAAVKSGGLLVLDWPTSDNPQERHDWIGVTTWSKAEQYGQVVSLGLQRVPSPDLSWPLFRVP